MSEDDFFSSKRPWSRIKDAILGSYMSPYIAKLARLGGNQSRRILIIDAFAGPGKFDDGTPGSPLIICQAAERYAKDNYEAIFINLEDDHHIKLSALLDHAGYRNAKAIHGDSRQILKQFHSRLDEPLTVFLYMDPFGLKDASFDLIRPFIERNPDYSTELLINLQAPALHRLAARKAFSENPDSKVVQGLHETLSQVLGGYYWKESMLYEELTPREREEHVIEGYRALLSSTNYLTYSGACPVQESRDSRAKYYMIFASRHLDAMKLFNDEMIKAFEQYMNSREFSGTLLADMRWQDWRDLEEVKKVVLSYIRLHSGRSREQLWGMIVQDYFLRFTSSEYKKSINDLVKEGLVSSPTPRKTYRLNDECILYAGQAS
jgi:three-Cys-motif partner protein